MEHGLAFKLAARALPPFPTGSSPVASACARLAQGYNTLAMRLVDAAAFEEAYELLKKAEVLVEPGSAGAGGPAEPGEPPTRAALAAARLLAVTHNNLGCYFRARGKPQASEPRELWRGGGTKRQKGKGGEDEGEGRKLRAKPLRLACPPLRGTLLSLCSQLGPPSGSLTLSRALSPPSSLACSFFSLALAGRPPLPRARRRPLVRPGPREMREPR